MEIQRLHTGQLYQALGQMSRQLSELYSRMETRAGRETSSLDPRGRLVAVVLTEEVGRLVRIPTVGPHLSPTCVATARRGPPSTVSAAGQA